MDITQALYTALTVGFRASALIAPGRPVRFILTGGQRSDYTKALGLTEHS